MEESTLARNFNDVRVFGVIVVVDDCITFDGDDNVDMTLSH